MLVGLARKSDPAHFAHRTARSVATCDPRGTDLARSSIGLPERDIHMVRLLVEADKLRVPLHCYTEVEQLLAHDALVIVLPQHQDEGKRTHAFADVADGNARRRQKHESVSLHPDAGAGRS